MTLQGVYKYCRPWALAREPDEGDRLTPIAPYAVDNSEIEGCHGTRGKSLTSTCRASYKQGWNEDFVSKTRTTRAAGGGASEREPHDSCEARGCIQHNKCHGGRTDYKEEMSIYQQASDRNALSRCHRQREKAQLLPHSLREARWYKCFRQLESQWDSKPDAQSRITGTDFSVLPAGYMPKNGQLPQKHIMDKYGKKTTSDAGAKERAPAAEAKSKKEELLPSPKNAWAQKVKDVGEDRLVLDSLQTKEQSENKKGFGAWAKAAKQRNTRAKKLKGAEYTKPPMPPSWRKKVESKVDKLKQPDLLSLLKTNKDGDIKSFTDK